MKTIEVEIKTVKKLVIPNQKTQKKTRTDCVDAFGFPMNSTCDDTECKNCIWSMANREHLVDLVLSLAK